MWRWIAITAAIASACFMLMILQEAEGCNEAVCGSIVSKCLLTKSCNCDLKNCTCCKDCFNCLSNLYSECCSCVDVCPKPNNDNEGLLNRKSNVEEFTDKVTGLFQVLTEYPDPQDRWTSFTFPVDLDITLFAPKKELKLQMQSAEQEVAPTKPTITTFNCTVAFMSQCTSWSKCRSSCQSMGASSYRWFHDGCCECVGETCINYGINESRCRKCSSNDELDDYGLPDEDSLDYGEDTDLDEDTSNMSN